LSSRAHGVLRTTSTVTVAHVSARTISRSAEQTKLAAEEQAARAERERLAAEEQAERAERERAAAEHHEAQAREIDPDADR